MVSHESRCLFLIIVSGIFVITACARSWDFAVVIGGEIDFYSRNKTLTGHAVIAQAVSLMAVAYDDTTRTMYLSDTRNNVSIFSGNLTEKNCTTKPLLKKANGTQILGMAFDTGTRTLFWTDELKHAIMRMRLPLNSTPEDSMVLHNLTDQIPHAISLDVCNRHLYWVNSNRTNPSIERSNLDGSDRRTVISENLYEPLAIAVDHREGKLYWSDDEEGIHFKIERSNFDGSEREIIVHAKHQTPVYLAVDSEAVYWSDWTHSTVWTIRKNRRKGDPAGERASPAKFKSYYESRRDADPAGIVARDNVGSLDCAAILENLRKRPKSYKPLPLPLVVESYNNLTTSTEESSDLTTESSVHCLNDGHFDKSMGSCRCQPGYSGSVCETSLCHNYCFRGKCIVNDRGLPKCECEATYDGLRCERNVCDGYCLHGGKCSIENGLPVCNCKYSKGKRCEAFTDLPEICALLCTNDEADLTLINAYSCKCTEPNLPVEQIVTFSNNIEYSTLLPILTAIIIVLILLVVALSYYVNKLRRRPRIKNIVINKGGGTTPLTSRPQLSDNQCEIAIENCCNMNICETPCFEPKLRSTVSRNSNTKKEEKNSLLDNMESNSC